jgi:hypothetical protein
MDDYIFITLPNEGEIPFNLRLILQWDMTDFEVIGETVFFTYNDCRMSMKLKDCEKFFPKHLPN